MVDEDELEHCQICQPSAQDTTAGLDKEHPRDVDIVEHIETVEDNPVAVVNIGTDIVAAAADADADAVAVCWTLTEPSMHVPDWDTAHSKHLSPGKIVDYTMICRLPEDCLIVDILDYMDFRHWHRCKGDYIARHNSQ